MGYLGGLANGMSIMRRAKEMDDMEILRRGKRKKGLKRPCELLLLRCPV